MKKKDGVDRKKRKPIIEINRDWCKGCGICAAFCPRQAIGKDEHEKAVWSDPEKCTACGVCELRCPDMAIEVKQDAGC